MNKQEKLKQDAAHRAVEFIKSGMVLGLGTGSTAAYAVKQIAKRLKAGDLMNIVGIPTSIRTEKLARELDIPLGELNAQPAIDVTIDGADEVDADLNLIKGGGGALLREKIVAQASHREIIVVDESKLSPALGTRWPVPVEVVPFGWRAQAAYLESLGAQPVLRLDDKGAPFETDQGNLIVDAHFGPIPALAHLATQLDGRAGIVAHGLFLGLATDVIVASGEGVQRMARDSRHTIKFHTSRVTNLSEHSI